ncbi:MAG: hypothetical protein RIR52_2212, partial [Acidobacteriota bacterium]
MVLLLPAGLSAQSRPVIPPLERQRFELEPAGVDW